MESSRTPPFAPLGRPPRGVQSTDVERAADALLRAGERPTVEKIRQMLGTGSPNTINPLLDLWWKQLATRLDAGPKALERLPEDVIHAAESLWHACLDQARVRAKAELRGKETTIDSKQSDQELQAEILSLREQELKARLTDRDRTIAILESQTKAFTALFRKEQAKSAAEAQRIGALQAELDSLRKLLASLSVRTALEQRSVQRTVAKKTTGKTKTKIDKRHPSKIARKKSLRQTTRGKTKRSTR